MRRGEPGRLRLTVPSYHPQARATIGDMQYGIAIRCNPLSDVVQKLAANRAARDLLAIEEAELLTEALKALPELVERTPDTADIIARDSEA